MAATKREKLRWLPLLIEACFVVFGVLLALGVNQWREHLNQEQHAATALLSIRHELDVNLKAVESALTYHLHLSDTLRVFLRQTDSQTTLSYPSDRLFPRGYIAPATLLSTAWEAANATDAITSMDYGDVLLLSRIYEEQRRYEYQARDAGELIYTKLFNEGHEGVLNNYANLRTLLASFWYRECGLLASYGEVLNHLGEDSEAESGGLPDLCHRVLQR